MTASTRVFCMEFLSTYFPRSRCRALAHVTLVCSGASERDVAGVGVAVDGDLCVCLLQDREPDLEFVVELFDSVSELFIGSDPPSSDPRLVGVPSRWAPVVALFPHPVDLRLYGVSGR